MGDRRTLCYRFLAGNKIDGWEIDGWHSKGWGIVVKPTFLIMGTQKGGTTSLYDAVTRHPMAGRATKKEVHFFDRYYDRGMEWYEQQFDLKPHQSQIGEATPIYMYDPDVRHRIATELPDVKVVVTLRDPVRRAYSHFWHSHRYGRETVTTFEDAVALEVERLTTAPSRQRGWWSYLDRGRYIDQLEALEKNFGRDSICVVFLEEVRKDPEAEISTVLRHLNLDPELQESFELPQANSYSALRPKELRALRAEGKPIPQDDSVTSYPPLDEGTRTRLLGEFVEYDERLMNWLDRRSLPWRPSAG